MAVGPFPRISGAWPPAGTRLSVVLKSPFFPPEAVTPSKALLLPSWPEILLPDVVTATPPCPTTRLNVVKNGAFLIIARVLPLAPPMDLYFALPTAAVPLAPAPIINAPISDTPGKSAGSKTYAPATSYMVSNRQGATLRSASLTCALPCSPNFVATSSGRRLALFSASPSCVGSSALS